MNADDVRRILARIEPGDYDRARALCGLTRDTDLKAALQLVIEEREGKAGKELAKEGLV